jgi:hypothetical protein
MLQADGVNWPNAQGLHYLTQIQHKSDIRKYCKKVDEMVYLTKIGTPLPPVAAAPRAAEPQGKICLPCL